jgi:G3E family GTPase
MAEPRVIIVTGFLGSGKTTMLRQMFAAGLADQRVALIVNEIGAIGFDGQALGGSQVTEMVELTAGCICCTVGSDFLLAVAEIVEMTAPDLIVVETTGLAEPWGMIAQVRASGQPLDAVVTLIDAANLGHALDLSSVARGQIRAADFLLLNKCDLVQADELRRLQELLRELNSRAAIRESVQGVVDPALVFGVESSSSHETAPADQSHLHADAIATLTWRNRQPLDRARFEAVLRDLPEGVYRGKGLVHCTEAPWPVRVNLVCGRVDLENTRLREPPEYLNELVLIGANLAGQELELQVRLDACADSPKRAADWWARRAE